ncbi:probable serine/threonine-protein kinase DDB_G0267686 [Chenopodium quinoa]|uniref:probable serine/threonine-protein kinase DDB_G0267686 n=1 Tax=Chenopodium quinoa TaxID=63459 RepID=UPI000B793E27|nr:probable serine/threonine-protein kinase DDB_G0267686 [Chenopodium quinoa]XP_021758086.1 probable serine/threonine-protein kinase DDB_G0267686 [Chenopodium quinoa]XP_021758087.1 probable serine/threonine-protein kinase DDB_G0267686 [Chenopodium quinoa]
MQVINMAASYQVLMSGEKKVNNNNNTNVDNSNSYSSVDNNNGSVDNNNSSVDNNDGCRACVGLIVSLLLIVALVCFIRIDDKINGDSNFKLEFQINSVEVTSMKVYNVSNDYYSVIVGDKKQHLMADLEFNLTLNNKVEGLMYFNPMEVSLEYHHDEFLSSTMLEPYLLVEDQHQLQFGMQIKDDDARLQNRTVDSISRDLADQNVVQFALKGKGRCVSWRRGAFVNCGINLLCDDIKVRILTATSTNLTTGSMIDSPLLCKFNSDCHDF